MPTAADITGIGVVKIVVDVAVIIAQELGQKRLDFRVIEKTRESADQCR